MGEKITKLNIEIVKIIDRGIAGKERLYLKSRAFTDLNYYIVISTTQIKDDKIIADPKNFFWFPSKNVKPNDSIILYTKSGKDSERKNSDGTNSYFFYWGLKNTILTNESEVLVLLELSSWQTIKT